MRTTRSNSVYWEGNGQGMPFADQDFIPVVLGTGLNAYGIARALHEEFGVRTLALGRFPLGETSHSKIIEVRTSPSFDDAHLVDTLNAIAQEFSGKRLLLLPTIEAYTNAVIRHRSELDATFIIPLVSQELSEQLVNKAEFYATCERLGVPHPRSVILNASTSSDHALGESLPFDFPVILKPSDTELYPGLKFPGQKKIYLVQDAVELRATASLIYHGGYVGDLIIQEYLSGDESVMKVANTYSDQHGKTRYVSIAQIVLGEHNPKLVGNMNAVVTIDEPELAASLTHLLDSLGYVGAANFDIMYDQKSGTDKLLELNIRQGAASYYATATGSNLPAQYVRDLMFGQSLPYTVTKKQVLWRNVPWNVARKYVPASLQAMARKAKRVRAVHTLWYRNDLSLQRIVANLKHEIRTARNVKTNEKFRINR